VSHIFINGFAFTVKKP